MNGSRVRTILFPLAFVFLVFAVYEHFVFAER